jgi:hypothetical protein
VAPRSVRTAAGYRQQILPNGTVTNTVVNEVLAPVLTGLADHSGLEVDLHTSAAATAGTDSLTILVDTSFDGGATWLNVANLQVLGNGGAVQKKVATLAPAAAVAATVTDATADLAANAVRPGVLGDQVRFRRAAVGTGSFTYGLFVAVRR